MLTLMMLRHAKAVQHGRGNDFARALTEKGEADALRLGAYLGERAALPDLALVSSAARTRQTFELFAQGAAANTAGAEITARFEESLYNATDRELCALLKLVDDRHRTLMFVGHNPGIMDAASLLAADGDPADLTRIRNRFPPGTLAVISFRADEWREARAGGGTLDLVLMPEDLTPPG